MSTCQLSYSQPLLRSSSSAASRRDNLSQSLTNRHQHASVSNAMSLNRSAPPNVFRRPPTSRYSSATRGKIPSMTGTRVYNRYTGRWEPEPVDATPPREKKTQLVDSLRKKWKDEMSTIKNPQTPYTTVMRESFKLPSLQPDSRASSTYSRASSTSSKRSASLK